MTVLQPSSPDRRDEAFNTLQGPFALTDLGNAERLVAKHGRDLRYVPAVGWHVWDGRRWQLDRDGEITRRMKTTVRSIDADVTAADDAAERKRLRAHATRSEARNKIESAIALAKSEADVVVTVDRLDADLMLLNVANGVVHLKAGELVEHEPDLLLTKLTPVKFDPNADAPRWHAFLKEIFLDDTDLIGFVKRAVGYTLTGLTREQVLFFLYGSGENGKTTFIETLRALFGEYAAQTPADTFVERPNDKASHELARLPGTRFVTAVETGEGRRLNETLVKRVTGGDIITARHLYKEFFEYLPAFKVWLATNHKPDVRGVDRAIWRRIRLIPFDATFPEGIRDEHLGEELLGELPGILRWAVDGCTEWLERRLDTPSSVKVATAAYQAESDVLAPFLDECCVLEPGARITTSELYLSYTKWADSSGERPLTKTALGKELRKRGFDEWRTTKERGWAGLRLRHEDDESNDTFSPMTRYDTFPIRGLTRAPTGPDDENPVTTRHLSPNVSSEPDNSGFKPRFPAP
jgi:putative DNA primase/helicase